MVFFLVALSGGALAFSAGKGLFWIGFVLGGASVTILKLYNDLADLRIRVFQLEKEEGKQEAKEAVKQEPQRVAAAANNVPATSAVKKAAQATASATVARKPVPVSPAGKLDEIRSDWEQATPAF